MRDGGVLILKPQRSSRLPLTWALYKLRTVSHRIVCLLSYQAKHELCLIQKAYYVSVLYACLQNIPGSLFRVMRNVAVENTDSELSSTTLGFSECAGILCRYCRTPDTHASVSKSEALRSRTILGLACSFGSRRRCRHTLESL